MVLSQDCGDEVMKYGNANPLTERTSETVSFLHGKNRMSMTDKQLQRLNSLIENENADAFYSWKPWKRLRESVLKLDNHECQLCKAKGKYRKAVVVHHVKHLKDRPDLAMSIYDGNERQLVSVCKQCHEELHPERTVRYRYEKKTEAVTVTAERWD